MRERARTLITAMISCERQDGFDLCVYLHVCVCVSTYKNTHAPSRDRVSTASISASFSLKEIK